MLEKPAFLNVFKSTDFIKFKCHSINAVNKFWMFHFKKTSNIISTIFESLYANNLELNAVCQIHIKNFLISSFQHMCFWWHTLRFHVLFSLKAVRISDYVASVLRVFACSDGFNLGITHWYIQSEKKIPTSAFCLRCQTNIYFGIFHNSAWRNFWE